MRKRTIITLSLLFSALSFLFSNTSAEQLLFITKYKDIAIQEMNRSGIPASITLAQAIIETDWGRSNLVKNSNNHFGIKCKGTWTGLTYHHKDDDYVNGKLIKSCFRAYEKVEDSFVDHSEFLMNNARYQKLFSFSNTDYKNWAMGLKECGYATSKTYAQALINTIEKFQLYQYDTNNVLAMAAPAFNVNVPTSSNPNDFKPALEQQELSAPPAFKIPEDYHRNKLNLNNTVVTTVNIPVETPITRSQPQKKKERNFQDMPSAKITEAELVMQSNEAIIVSAAANDLGFVQLNRTPRVNSNLRR